MTFLVLEKTGSERSYNCLLQRNNESTFMSRHSELFNSGIAITTSTVATLHSLINVVLQISVMGST